MPPAVRRRTVPFAGGLALAALTTACAAGAPGAVPDEPADVSGVVARGAAAFGGGPALTQVSDDYYEGMALVTDETDVLDADGVEAGVDLLVEGAVVEVWVGEVCAESYPVQCGVEVVHVVEP